MTALQTAYESFVLLVGTRALAPAVEGFTHPDT